MRVSLASAPTWREGSPRWPGAALKPLVRWRPVASAARHLIHDREDNSLVDVPVGCATATAPRARSGRAPCHGMLAAGRPSPWCDTCHNIDVDTIDPPDYPHANSR
jgi:hypothetical protein